MAKKFNIQLNIWVTVNQSLLPVLVWVHGGGLQSGCSSQSIPRIYNGTNIIARSLQQQSVIVVTINYRLGVLDDMYSTELIQENSSEWPTAGNYLYYTNKSNALDVSNKIVQNMNCSKGNSEMTLACLRNSSIENLTTTYGYRQTKPIVDGYFFHFIHQQQLKKENIIKI
ncbi:unnamed protein product [Rotaria magnacalcarata]|uniref:Carboxylesterase type B domain-containing protein n=1 Tax=Rotaria magnacalcarata TaxID=392030 RepID=A0A820NCZ5_9BILA|nr:unnamed protein product [Rotaria magnacalcarata]